MFPFSKIKHHMTKHQKGIAEANNFMDEIMSGVEGDLSAASREVQAAMGEVESSVQEDIENVDHIL